MIAFNRVLFALFVGMLVTISVDASRLRLSLNKSILQSGEPVELQMSFIDSPEQPRLQTPDFPGFKVVSQRTQSSFRFDNGRQTSEFTYTYELLPEKKGKLTIGPFQVKIAGKELISNQVTVEVNTGVAKQRNQYSIDFNAWFDQTEVFSGQQVNYILEFWRPAQGIRISQPKFSIPEFTDFIVEQDQARQDEREELKDGLLYFVTKVSVPIITVKQGEFEFPAGVATYNVPRRGRRSGGLFSSMFGVDPFALGSPKKAYAKPVNIRVNALPTPRPVDFDGLVGQFVIESQVDKTKVSEGGNLTLELKLTGVGNLQDWQAPSLEIPGFKVYADGQAQLKRKRTVNGLLGGIQLYKYALVPQKSGKLEIGPFSITTFNPKKKIYESAETKKLLISVEPGKQQDMVFVSSDETSEVKNDEKQKIKRLSKDVLPILTEYWEGDNRPLSRQSWLIVITLTILSVILFQIFKNWWSARHDDPLEMAYHEAYQLLLKELGNTDPAGQVISLFLLRKLKLQAREVTPQELQIILKDSKVSEDLQRKLLSSLQLEEQSRYTGGAESLSHDDWLQLAKQVQSQL